MVLHDSLFDDKLRSGCGRAVMSAPDKKCSENRYPLTEKLSN